MTGGQDGDDTEFSAVGDRPWQHPSEVGLAVRGRSDRRRSTLIATGVVLSGLGLLITGVALGSMRHDGDPDDLTTASVVEQSVANVVVVVDGMSTTVTGLVMDDRGHLLVPAGAVDDADELWARCADGMMESAELIATDPTHDVAVLRIETPAGSPPDVAASLPAPGAAVLAVDAVPGAVTTADAVVGEHTSGSGATGFTAHVDAGIRGGVSDGTLVFDRDGALLGTAVGPDSAARADAGAGEALEVRSATTTMDAARQMLRG